MSSFSAVTTTGAVLPADALARAVDLQMPGQAPADYGLVPGQGVNAAVARAWEQCLLAHRAWRNALAEGTVPDGADALTRKRWLHPLLYELGHGNPVWVDGIEVPPALGQSEPERLRITHRMTWPANAAEPEAGVPIHLIGAERDLDTRPERQLRSPNALVQEFLNRHPRYLWGILSNGHTLRVMRDASSLARQAHVEFDLDDIFDNQRYADFRLLWLTVHATRFAPVAETPNATDPDGEGDDGEPAETPPLSAETCLLERWRTTAIADGARALKALRLGVARAIEHLGTGFVSHPANIALVDALRHRPNAADDLRRSLLRVAYRLLVLFVAEDRGRLHPHNADSVARDRYTRHFSTARLRRLAATRPGTPHTDLWAAHLLVTDGLAGDGRPEIAVPGIAASLFERRFLNDLDGAVLSNRALLDAVRALSRIVDPVTGVERPVDFRNLDSEELGGVYEGLLAYQPRYDPQRRTFSLTEAAGNERKKSGSYYTPTGLIELVLDEALDPLIVEARRAHDAEAALLGLTVVDPAVGSGHFVVAAARRIAKALAIARTGDPEPGRPTLDAAIADVVEHCVFGVDVNELAIEITKVALWMEAFDGSRPLPFLDTHFKVGNALLGATPKLLADGVPDAAFTVLTGDDKEWTRKLKARNKTERARSRNQLWLDLGAENGNAGLANKVRAIDEQKVSTADEARARADAWRAFETKDPELAALRFAADAWCAAFVQPKRPTDIPGITHATVARIADGDSDVPARVRDTVLQKARQHRFFHWHLEFPTIFTVPAAGDDDVDLSTGWRGGFSCVVGNPPWERVKIQDKEFFAACGADAIANASTAAIRKRMIAELEFEAPDLFASYQDAQRESDAVIHLVRSGGRMPLTSSGDVNTYSVFAETFRTLVAEQGAAGIITPTGLATDKTTSEFFGDTLEAKRLLAFYDFENEAKVFAGVHNQFRFAATVMSGPHRVAATTRFAFYTRYLTDVPERRFDLAAEEVVLMNPNTGTLPVFRTRRDAEITLKAYRRHPVLIRDGDAPINPWGLDFCRLFDMANDSELFLAEKDLGGSDFDGWSYHGHGRERTPLYEAKMLGHFDHRYSTYRDATQAQLNKGTLPRPSAAQHDDPNMEPLARYWVDGAAVRDRLALRWDRAWLLGWRDIARASDMRTFVPSVLPTSAVGHVFPLAFPKVPAHGPLLHAVWSSLAFDYVARQKLSGTHMTYNIVKQLACPPPTTFDQPTDWLPEQTLERWVLPYVRELAYTSWRLRPYALDMGDEGPPFCWDTERRELLRADLDAAFLHVYGLDRTEAEHVLDSFFVVRKYEVRDHGEFRIKRLVLDAYDRMAAATARGGHGWLPLADIPAGAGPRHPARPAQEGIR
ncbi:restriction endonuclease [Pseudonocardia sp. TMWB2A]